MKTGNIFDIDTAKSYATRANLEKKLDQIVLEGHRYVIVCNTQGRWTAIFPSSNFRDGGYVAHYAQHGFLTM